MNERVALVTGGAGGLGTALCARLAALGYAVVVVDLDLPESLGDNAFRADVGGPEDNRAMVAHVLERHGRLDLVVLNAGVNSEQPPDVPVSLERYRRTNAVNVDGVVFGIDAATPALARQGGAIVVTASLAALDPERANPLYALGKSAVLGYVRAMSVPLARNAITINALCPGFTDTPIPGIAKRLMRKQGFPLLTPGGRGRRLRDRAVRARYRAGVGGRRRAPAHPGRVPARPDDAAARRYRGRAATVPGPR